MFRVFCLVSVLLLPCAGFAAEKMNVLMIAIDDLANALHSQGHPVVKTPNLDRLAESGVRFDRAYCQIPLCNPSRASVLTGMRPDVTKVYDLDRHFRDEVPEVVTLPQLFRQNGWFVARVGKLYHYNVPFGIGTNGLDDEVSWDEVVNPKGRDVTDEALITNAEPHRPISGALSWLAADGEDEEQTDGMIATEAIRLMTKYQDGAFFIGAGFFRPHTPYVAPRKYFEMYPLDEIRLPEAPEGDREDIPSAAFAHNCPVPNYNLPEETCRQALQAYYASVSFVDAQVGRLLDALDNLGLTDRTMIVLWSDHGYHLGEHNGVWQKRTLFEESARAPMMIRLPSAKGNGTACERIVEFIDMYPTTAVACGLEVPKTAQGRSLMPLLENPAAAWNGRAFTQILRPGDGQPFVGRSIRTERWRYSDWDGGALGEELYDHVSDPDEWTNLAQKPQWQEVAEELRAELDRVIEAAVPATPFLPGKL